MSEVDMLTRYYAAKEREESIVIEINDAYLETLEALEILEAENAKLRELMRDTYDCICEMYRYMDGRYAYEDAEADPAYGPILKRMHELGVEVDDG